MRSVGLPTEAGVLPGGAPLPDVVAVTIRLDRAYRLWAHSLGLACCAVEAAAALATQGRAQGSGNDSGPAVDVLVVAGTVTDRMAPAVLALHRRLRPAHVVSFGACASSGGPYWDSYAVTKGVDQLLPVDLYVPGCPPRPAALLAGLASLPAPGGEDGR